MLNQEEGGVGPVSPNDVPIRPTVLCHRVAQPERVGGIGGTKLGHQGGIRSGTGLERCGESFPNNLVLGDAPEQLNP
jgi:hypothetical protein